MDAYGVIEIGNYLVSIPGAVLYLAIVGSLLWLSRERWWANALVLFGFNAVWMALGLSFVVRT